MKVFLTGGAGYIGTKLVKKLLDSGHKVRVYDSLVYGARPLIYFMDNPNFELVHGDVNDLQQLDTSMQGCDAVIHLAALVFMGGKELYEHIMRVNYMGTRNLVDLCKEKGIERFIFSSTCSNYGITTNIVNENSPLVPTSPYAESKVKAEKYILESVDEEFEPTILRLSTVFGLSPRMRFDLTVNDFVNQAILNERIVVRNPKAWRPSLHIDDATEAMKMCLEDTNAKGVFNVGHSSLNYQKIHLCDIIKKHIPSLEVTTRDASSDHRDYRVSFDKIQKKLGFCPKKTLEQGIEELIIALRKGVFPVFHETYDNLEIYKLWYHK